MTRLLYFLFFSSLVVFSATKNVAAQEEPNSEEKDWLEYYYQDPTPLRFVEQMKDWAADGTLELEQAKPALVAFLSQVLRQNRAEIENWYKELSGLTPEQQQVLHSALLYSRVSEADELMTGIFGKSYRERRSSAEKILEMPLDRETTINMLWGFFYATGSENALRRLVLCFRFEDAPANPEGYTIPEGYTPYYTAIPQLAFNSLLANAERHPRVRSLLESMLQNDSSLLKSEKQGIRGVLSEVDPETFPPLDTKSKSA